MEYGKKISVGGFAYLKFKRFNTSNGVFDLIEPIENPSIGIDTSEGGMSFIKVSTIMDHWSMEWREDTLVYHALDSDLDNDQLAAVNVAVVNAFMCGCFLDGEFQHSVQVAAGELQERMNAEAKVEVSEEEDAEILNQLRTETEMYEELGKELNSLNNNEQH